ncbi:MULTISPECIES: XRE family transcriptional regulator [unclassified Oceanispirochaeta]|uniref:XRE family transcriptional regulator n=1 Tax=unclassified Oceanispirochaeta TaxID=2635722 RepID=UPI000E09152E|nr:MULTISPECIES: XRE family transcriptional regulator [unclassified Oceanispirochaeta]MBF9018615.1 ImmA/IrrE family metallo-endopeptidase [Oceanispirochaeta sp. M2]NPD75052.1 ImmA/IrrE family metallo-endopeptidase [Oceanispirochaeta sp. M1]RDG29079.1 ImmA/IrrE family metallo-endopeptidase [Oceanispirochaeta sp. M1]
MDNRIKAEIEPSILIWARERYSTTHEIVAQKTNISEENIINFEEGDAQPSFAQLRKIANFFRLSISAFFLPYPPGREAHVTASLRRLSGMSTDSFSIELTREIIDAIEKRDFYLSVTEPNDIIDWPFTEEKTYNAVEVRDILGFDIGTQRSWRDSRIAFNTLRYYFESLGILVFQVSKIAIDEFRACAISEYPIPIIIINRSDSYNGRSFSMVHELYHLINQQYDIEINPTAKIIPPELISIEQDANSFASDFLIPSDVFLSEITRFWRDDPDQFIYSISRKYSVSKEFIARRLLDEKIIDENYYYLVRDEGIKRSKRKGGFVPPNVDCLSKNGKIYSSAVFEELLSGRLSRVQASSYLDVKEKWFDRIQGSL